MKLWVAEKSFELEDFYILGIFSSKDKAIEASQDFENRNGFVDLEFKETNKLDAVLLAQGDTYEYMVWEIEVDKPLESED